MADKIPLIYDDPRPVFGIWYDEGGGYNVGHEKVTKIVAYKESGEMSYVPFFAVYRGDDLFRRVPALHVTVSYQSPEDRKRDLDEELPF